MHIAVNSTNPAQRKVIDVTLPLSKSISNRFLILNALFGNPQNRLTISESRDSVLLQNALMNPSSVVWFQDGATPFRFYLAYAALKNINCIVTGDAGLQKRSIEPLTNALQTMGARFAWPGKRGYLPVELIKGIGKSNHVNIDRSLSSQYVSAIMLIAPALSTNFTIEMQGNPNSDAYIRLTAWCLSNYGIETLFKANQIVIQHNTPKVPQVVMNQPDWTSAAWIYMLCAATPGSEFIIRDLNLNSPQEDKLLADFYIKLGVKSEQRTEGLSLKQDGMPAADPAFDLRNHIDLAPAMICTAAFLGIKARFYNIENLRFKESDRIMALNFNLQQWGIQLEKDSEGWILVYRESPDLQNYRISTFHDHRIAMAFSVFSLRNPLTFDDADCVEKSFPRYWEVFRSIFQQG